jgi:hypothetical protein
MVTGNDSATLTEASRLDAVRSFDFYVTALEDGLLAALQHSCLWAKTVNTYAGELDEAAIREGLARLVNKMPAILVTYGQGEDVQAPGMAAIAANHPGILASTQARAGGAIAIANLKPRVFQHNCLFSAIIVSNDTRGELARRRAKTETGGVIPGAIGLYQMMGEVKAAIDDLQFYVSDPNANGGMVRLNTQPFRPVAVDYMAKLPDITAYAVHWETAFKYRTPDRTPQYPLVKDLIVEVTNTESFDNTHPGAPGLSGGVRN